MIKKILQDIAEARAQSAKKVFIVGGTGMLGKSVSEHLLNKGYNITSISLPTDDETDLIAGVEYILKDINTVSDTDMLHIMRDKDYMVIALGADERYIPKAPAFDFFRQENVTYITNLLRLARLCRIEEVVILGSYFTYFNRIWPELKLKETHPYIRSRVEQMELAFTFNSGAMQVMILEIPYVFGTLPKHTPLWSIVSDQLHSNNHIYYPLGGTAMVTSHEVAEAVEGAFLYGVGGTAYPVASINLKWKDFLSYLLNLQGQGHKILTPYSNFATKREMRNKMRQLEREGLESGIDLVEYLEFQKRDAYLDINKCICDLRYNPDNLKDAIEETILACQEKTTFEE